MRVPVITPSAEAWVAFAEERNFTRAAERLHLSQPALHTKIARFQTEVGMQLYRREGASTTITPFGEVLASFVRELVQQREDFALRIAPSRPLTLVAGAGAYMYLLGPAINETFARTDTHLSLSIDQGENALDMVRRGRADLAVGVFDDLPQGLHADEVARFPQVAALSATHPLGRSRSVTLAELSELPLIMAPQGHRHRVRLDQAFREQGLQPHVAIEAEGWELMARFVMMGVGCAVMHSYVPEREGLAMCPVKDLADVRYHVVTKANAADDRDVVRLVDTIKGTLRRFR